MQQQHTRSAIKGGEGRQELGKTVRKVQAMGTMGGEGTNNRRGGCDVTVLCSLCEPEYLLYPTSNL
jgi:hypothetical protein